ncbi:hypothetical protein Nepgr_014300 [Nepenthes gracilis]|uniref:Uncharacterized protein n=1 Tax=Nepenthes gracilis TaxID=150966 RepID=A0AAD3SKN5_NEPGR|nr:hypothetical protein Nepgr_014300 [Nepenthes gracilis]
MGQFYRVHVAIQSPEWVTSVRELLIRFNDYQHTSCYLLQLKGHFLRPVFLLLLPRAFCKEAGHCWKSIPRSKSATSSSSHWITAVTVCETPDTGTPSLERVDSARSSRHGVHKSQITENGNASKAFFLTGDSIDPLLEVAETAKELAMPESSQMTVNSRIFEAGIETTKQKSKENMQQALLIGKESVTKMQWDMEELRWKSLAMELRLKSQRPQEGMFLSRGDELPWVLDATKEQLAILGNMRN